MIICYNYRDTVGTESTAIKIIKNMIVMIVIHICEDNKIAASWC